METGSCQRVYFSRVRNLRLSGCPGQPKICWGNQITCNGCPRDNLYVFSPTSFETQHFFVIQSFQITKICHACRMKPDTRQLCGKSCEIIIMGYHMALWIMFQSFENNACNSFIGTKNRQPQFFFGTVRFCW